MRILSELRKHIELNWKKLKSVRVLCSGLLIASSMKGKLVEKTAAAGIGEMITIRTANTLRKIAEI